MNNNENENNNENDNNNDNDNDNENKNDNNNDSKIKLKNKTKNKTKTKNKNKTKNKTKNIKYKEGKNSKDSKDSKKKNINNQNNINYSNKISDDLLTNFKLYLKKNIHYNNSINNFMLDGIIKIINHPSEPISCFDDNGLSFIETYFDKINDAIHNNINNSSKKHFLSGLKKKRDDLNNNLKNINIIIKELINFKNFLKIENLYDNDQKKNLNFLNSRNTLFLKEPYIIGECVAHFLFLTIKKDYNLSDNIFYENNLFNTDKTLKSFTELNDIIKYFLFYYTIITSFASKENDYSILFNEKKREELIKKIVKIVPYMKKVENPAIKKSQQQQSKKKTTKRGGGDKLLNNELKKTEIETKKLQKQESEKSTNDNALINKIKKDLSTIKINETSNLYNIYTHDFYKNMKDCYENYYKNHINEYKDGKIKNLFNGQEISIIDILNDEYIKSVQKNIKDEKTKTQNKINAKKQANALKNILIIPQEGGIKKKKGQEKKNNVSIKPQLIKMNVFTLILKIDYSKKFTFLQSMNYLNEEKNKIEINIFLKNLKTQLIDILLLFYINKKEIIKTFLNAFSNRKSILNKNININININDKNNIIENNNTINNIVKNKEENNTKNKIKKNYSSIVNEKLKFYNLKNTVQIKKVAFLLNKLEEIKSLKNTLNYDKMVIEIEHRIRTIILSK